jgi:hypothetical protein
MGAAPSLIICSDLTQEIQNENDLLMALPFETPKLAVTAYIARTVFLKDLNRQLKDRESLNAHRTSP